MNYSPPRRRTSEARDRRTRAATAKQKSRSRHTELRFVTVFFAVIAAFYTLTAFAWVDRHLVFPVMAVSARGASWLLNLGGAHTVLDGICIRGPDFAVAVRRGCDPIEPIVLLGAALCAFPSSLKRKGSGILLGGTFLFALNVVRISTLYVAGRAHVAWFDHLHQEWWPAGFILATLGSWFGWLHCLRLRAVSSHA